MPQEQPSYVVEALLAEAAGDRFVAASKRPALEQCDERAFEKDLVGFLMARGDVQLAAAVREHRITW